MDFDLTPDQEELRETARTLARGLFPIEAVRRIGESQVLDRSLWAQLADAGMFSLHLPEVSEGLGLGMTEVVIAFQELGRGLVPGPLVATTLLAGLIDSAESGDVIGIAESTLSEPTIVEHLSSLDWIAVLSSDGLGVARARDLKVDPDRQTDRFLDPLTPFGVVTELAVDNRIGGGELAARIRRDGALLVAAQAAGVAAAACELAVAYAMDRQQFDRPIGSFQAVKHLLADMRVRAELAQVAVESAAVLIDEESDDEATVAVSSAKVIAGEAAMENGRTCVQVHGGMGFVWEVDAHLFQKRAWVLDQQFGTAWAHGRRLADSW